MCEKLCLLVTVVCLVKSTVFGNPVPCHPESKVPYLYTGTKTPYSYVHNDTGAMTLTNCEPTQVWMLIRHGTRYPDESTIARISNLTRTRDRIITTDTHETCATLYEKKDLKNWQPYSELVLGKGKYLAIQGEKDMAWLAERIRARLPTLFSGNVTKSFKFRSTATQRTVASMRSFIKRAFKIIPINDTLTQYESMDIQQTVTLRSLEEASSNTSISIEIVPIANDTLLKLYDTCESWKSTGVNDEVYAFINGPEITTVLADVGRRSGLPGNISKEDAFLFYDTCRFERSLHPNEPSPWCDVFTDDEMRVLEYKEDLYYYYRVGPGEGINSELGCHLIQDMLDHFAKLEMNGDESRGVFYFTHSHMITLFLTTMGIAKDPVPLTAANFRDMDLRNWRISRLMPFAANFAAVFHRCDSSDAPFKVAFYLNENPLTLEGCENGVCDWAQLKKKLGAIAANCSAKVCQIKS